MRRLVIPRVIVAGLRLHEVPQMGDIDENDPERGSTPLLGVLGLFHFDSYEYFAPQISHFSRGVTIAASVSTGYRAESSVPSPPEYPAC